MYPYFLTDGKFGELILVGSQSTEPTPGHIANGFYRRPGMPGPNYTTKKSEFDVWDSVNMVWAPNPSEEQERALKQAQELIGAKVSKRTLLKQVRDSVEYGPFIYNGMVFDGDLDAQRRLSVLVSAAKTAIVSGYSFTKDFTLADNTVVQLNAEDFIGIEMAKLWQVDAAFQEYRLKRAAIEAAKTLEELEAVTI